jgi:diaminopimelate decarboxylase
MHPFGHLPVNGMLHYPDIAAHRVAIGQVLQRRGTPIFLGERANLVDRYRTLQRGLQARWPRHIIGYSFKTNYLVARCGVLQELGAWAEVVSQREYCWARELGYAGQSIIFNGPWKPDEALRTAIADGALVNINDHDELDRILRLAALRDAPLDVGLRVSSTLPRLGHSRFGFSLENAEAAEAVDKLARAPRANLVALHTHLYGDTDDPELYALAAQRLGEFARTTIADYERRLKFVDLGGGFPAHAPKPKSRTTWNPRPIDEYLQAICAALAPFFPRPEARPTLIVEPGRYLTSDAIMLVTRVVHVKRRDGRQLVNCDGSISMVPLTHYCPQVIRAYTPALEPRETNEVPTVIQGSTCRENDLLYEGTFPRLERGDYLVHFAAGAYNSSLSPDFIFAAPGMELF